MVDPFVQFPTPWTGEYDEVEQRWFIIDAVGNDIFEANRSVENETIKFLLNAVNSKGDK